MNQRICHPSIMVLRNRQDMQNKSFGSEKDNVNIEERFDIVMQINWTEERNLTMLTDYYEFTMSNGYFINGMKDKIAVFDMFFRNIPDGGGFAVFAGLEQMIHYLENLRFYPAGY